METGEIAEKRGKREEADRIDSLRLPSPPQPLPPPPLPLGRPRLQARSSSRAAQADLSPYDPEGSSSVSKLGCGEAFCSVLSGGGSPTCAHDDPCKFTATYGDGSSATGYYVTDLLSYNQVSEDHKTRLASANVTFGCASKQTGASSVGIEGLMGFGQANSSTISQLASSGKVRKIFAHCLDTIKGGGIFAVGNVVEPKVKMTPLIPKMLHYNVNLTSIDVGGKMLRLPLTMFQTREKSGTIIDSGTTLAYLPEIAYKRLIDQIFSDHQNLTLTTSTDNFTCFSYSESMDDAFPVVTFNFEMNVTLEVKPHDYFFKNKDVWCIGWQNNGDKDAILLGDITLSNRLVIYDLENQAVGWTDYDCSSSIKVEDDTSKAVNSIDAHALPYDPPSSASILEIGRSILLVPLVFLLHLHN
ncbi:uncharacterized protein A4U43_C09F16370 [Asparagus officinalis]|uniref:Peptidase A1 domain-containing protein n=1 Tax=Asparagus officinalis TaxID=4686 RepID=A0A5P1E860_ASPOF|nr:uncharacterized protein A4U43_C09F16370 [Asparagus officinalis]